MHFVLLCYVGRERGRVGTAGVTVAALPYATTIIGLSTAFAPGAIISIGYLTITVSGTPEPYPSLGLPHTVCKVTSDM